MRFCCGPSAFSWVAATLSLPHATATAVATHTAMPPRPARAFNANVCNARHMVCALLPRFTSNAARMVHRTFAFPRLPHWVLPGSSRFAQHTTPALLPRFYRLRALTSPRLHTARYRHLRATACLQFSQHLNLPRLRDLHAAHAFAAGHTHAACSCTACTHH